MGRALALLAVAALWACSDDSPETTVVDGREVFVIEAFACDDETACAKSVLIAGHQYAIGCHEPAVEAPLRGELYAVGESSLLVSEARVIRGADPSERVALYGSACGDEGWYLGRASESRP